MLRRKALKAVGTSGVLLGLGQASIASAKSLSFGLLPNLSSRVLFDQYEPVTQYLAAAAGAKVVVSSASSWRAFYHRAADHQFNVMVCAPHIARLMQKELGFLPIATLTPSVEAVLVCKKNQNVQHLDFIRGKTVAAANPACLISVEGEVWLAKQGLQCGDDYITVNVRGADSVGVMIERGDAIAGLMSIFDFKSHPHAITKNLKVVQGYAVLPSFVILIDPIRSPLSAGAMSKIFHEFALSPFADAFELRSGSRIENKVSENFAASMDRYLTTTRQKLHI